MFEKMMEEMTKIENEAKGPKKWLINWAKQVGTEKSDKAQAGPHFGNFSVGQYVLLRLILHICPFTSPPNLFS